MSAVLVQHCFGRRLVVVAAAETTVTSDVKSSLERLQLGRPCLGSDRLRRRERGGNPAGWRRPGAPMLSPRAVGVAGWPDQLLHLLCASARLLASQPASLPSAPAHQCFKPS